MSDLLSNLVRRIEPASDVRPRIASRFEQDRFVSETGERDFVAEPSIAPPAAVEAVPALRGHQVPVAGEHHSPPLTRPALNQDRQPIREDTDLDAEAASAAIHSPHDAFFDRTLPSVAAVMPYASNSMLRTMNQRLDQLRVLVAGLQQPIAAQPHGPLSFSDAPEPKRNDPEQHQKDVVHIERTIVEHRAEPLTVAQLEDVVSPRAKRPGDSAVRQPALVMAQAQPQQRRSRPQSVEQPQTARVARRQAAHRAAPRIQAEKPPAQRAAEAARSEATVKITIGRVEVRALGGRNASLSHAPRRETPAVMSLDEYVARRASGRIA